MSITIGRFEGVASMIETLFANRAIESFKDFDPNIYQTSSYDSGYELLQELGEVVALEMPNPEPEEVTFCLFQISTSRQMCALLSDYKVSRTDFENIINNSERHFPADYYACPDGSCSATPEYKILFLVRMNWWLSLKIVATTNTIEHPHH